MKRIIITDKIKQNFKKLIFCIFKEQNNKLHLIKKEKGEIKFDITLKELERLLDEKDNNK